MSNGRPVTIQCAITFASTTDQAGTLRSGRLRGSPLLILLPVRSGSVKTAGRRAGEKGDQADQPDQRGFIPDENHAGIRDAVRDFQKPEEGNSGGTHF